MVKTLLQIFLYVQVFIIGMLVVEIYKHAHEHFRQTKAKPKPEDPELAKVGNDQLPEAIRRRMLEESELKFQSILNNSTNKLENDLSMTANRVNTLIGQMAQQIVESELERYHQQLTQLHKQAETDIANIKTGISKHEGDIKAHMTKELEAEKAKLIQQIDTKLADAMGSFLVDALGHNIDLGSQTAYLVSLLDEHKADFKKEVAG